MALYHISMPPDLLKKGISQPELPRYNPFEKKLLTNWLFDSYPSDAEGGDQISDLLYNFKQIILSEYQFKKIIKSELAERSDEIIDRMIKLIDRKSMLDRIFLKKTEETYTMHNKGLVKDIREKYFINTIINEDTLKIYKKAVEEMNLSQYEEVAYPVSLIASEGGHAIGTYYRKLSSGKFLFYVINAGDGADYQNILDSSTRNYGIQCFEIDIKQLNFIYSLLFAGNRFITVETFYNVVLRILFVDEENFFDIEGCQNKFLHESPCFKKSINLDLQVMGNCTVVSFVNVIEIILREEDLVTPTMCNFDISQKFLNFYNKIKILILYYFLGYFINYMAESQNYPLFIKMNEVYLMLKDSPYKVPELDQVNDILANKLYEFYMDDIENYTNLNGYDTSFYEIYCNEIKKIERVRKNDSFNLEYLKAPLEYDEDKIKSLEEKLDSILEKLSTETIKSIDKFEDLESYLKNMSEYLSIVVNISANTEDYIRFRLRQYQLIELIIELYKKVKDLISSNSLDKKFDIKNISLYIYNISCINDTLNINFYNTYYGEFENSYKESENLKEYMTVSNKDDSKIHYKNYRLSIYDSVNIYLIFMIGRINDYICENKIQKYDFSDKYLLNRLSEIFSNFIISNKKDYDSINDLLMETIENYHYLLYFSSDKEPENINQEFTPAGIGFGFGRPSNKYNLNLKEIIIGSNFKFPNMSIEHEESNEPKKKKFFFVGLLDLSHFCNLFKDELKEKSFSTPSQYLNYIDKNLLEPQNINWILLKLNLLFYKARFSSYGYITNYGEEIEKKKIEKIINFEIKMAHQLPFNRDRKVNINNMMQIIDNYFYNKNNLIYQTMDKSKDRAWPSAPPMLAPSYTGIGLGAGLSTSSSMGESSESSTVTLDLHSLLGQHLITYNDFFILDEKNIHYNSNLTIFNLEVNREIFNSKFYEEILMKIDHLITNNLINIEHYQSIFNIMIMIFNIYVVMGKKLNKDDKELCESIDRITKHFSPILKFILNKYHDFECDYTNEEIIEYLDKMIKFKKTTFINTNLDSLINLVFDKVNEDPKLKQAILINNNFKKIIIKTIDPGFSKYISKLTTKDYNIYNNSIEDKLGSLELVTKVGKFKSIDKDKIIRTHVSESLGIFPRIGNTHIWSYFGFTTDIIKSTLEDKKYNLYESIQESKKRKDEERKIQNINIKLNNYEIHLKYIKNHYYNYFQITNHVYEDISSNLVSKEVFIDGKNSFLQLYYKPEYSYLIDLDYVLENIDNDKIHVANKDNDKIKIILNDDNINITINDNKVLLLTDLISNSRLLEIYIKLMKLININFSDENTKKENRIKMNELLPIQMGNKVKFDCKELKIYFTYDLESNILTYMDDEEIITNKGLYINNRFIYNTDCMIVKHKNLKYSIMLMGKENKSMHFVKLNNNGLFSEYNPESIIYLIKQLLNVGGLQEANMIYLNLDQIKDSIPKNLNEENKIFIEKFSKLNSVYFGYFVILLDNYVELHKDREGKKIDVEKIKQKINMNQIIYFNYFKYFFLTDVNIGHSNRSFLSNTKIDVSPELLKSPTREKDKTITKALFIKNFANTSDFYISDYFGHNQSVLDSIESYEHVNYEVARYSQYHHEFKKHINRKVIINEKDWDFGPNILDGIEISKIKKEDFIKEDIDTKFFTESKILKEEYKDDSKGIIADYNAFYADECAKERAIINQDNLRKLLVKVKEALNEYFYKNNEENKKTNSIRYENISYANIIVDFDISSINRIMLINKFNNFIEEINSLLTTSKEQYDISKLYNNILSKPIFIGKEINSYLICFEFLFGNHIRQKQLDFADNLYNEILLKNTKTGPNLHQLLMGEGKSSVIAPVLTLNLLANNEMHEDSIIYQVMPVSLVPQSYDIFNRIFYYLDKNILGIIKEKDDLTKLFNKKVIIISDYLMKYAKVTSNNIKEFDMCKNIFIYDEVDEVSDPLKSQLNIISGKPRKINNSDLTFKFIHDFIYDLYFNPECDHIRKELSKYQFNLFPHLINQNIDIHEEAKKIIDQMFHNKIEEILGKKYLSAYVEIILKNNMSHPIEGINLDILNLLFSFDTLIPNILTQLHRRHFGLKYNNFDDISLLIGKDGKKSKLTDIGKNFIAVPFISNETPTEKSEFSDHLYTIALTVICYYEKNVRRIRNIDIQIYLDFLSKLYLVNKFKKLEKNPGYVLYNQLIQDIEVKDRPTFSENLSVKYFKKKDIQKIVDRFPIDYYLLNILLPKVIRINDDYKNISFIDIIKSSFSPHRIGFTGTPFIHKPCEYECETEIKNICKQIYGDGAIVASIIGFTRKAESFENINNKEEVLDLAISNSYHCIIDVGSYFINDTSDKIAQNIMEKLIKKESEIKCVVFINKSHKKMALLADGKIVSYDSLTIQLKDRFYFYDQSHITGIDMKIYSEAKGLITLSSFNRYRDVAQGIFRLRNINNGQTIDFCFNKNFKENLDKNKLSLINFLIYNEFRYKLSQSSLFFKQNILTLYRTYFEDKDIYKIEGISEDFSYLKTNIYQQSYRLKNITDKEDVKIDLVKLYIKQIHEVVKHMQDEKLTKIICDLLENVNFESADSTAENEEEGEQLGEEEPESQELSIEQPVEQPIEQSLNEDYKNEHYVNYITNIEIKCMFEIEKFKKLDIIDKDFRIIRQNVGECSQICYLPYFTKNEADLKWESDIGFKEDTEKKPDESISYGSAGFTWEENRARMAAQEAKEEEERAKKEAEEALKPKYPNYDPVLRKDYQILVGGNRKKKCVISRYLFKHIINNIFIPSTNISYNTRLLFDVYGHTYNYLNFICDSFIEIFDNSESNCGNFNHIILLNNNQALRIIKETMNENCLLRFRTRSGFIYYDSDPSIEKKYPANYDNTTLNLALILVNSRNITNLNIVNILDELCEKPDDLIRKFRIKESPLTYLFGYFTKDDFYNVMLLLKIINDYNIYYENKTEIYNIEQMPEILSKIKENMSRCSDGKTIERYSKIFEKDWWNTYQDKFEHLYVKYVALNGDNVLKSIYNARQKIENLWDIIKIMYKYDKDFNDNSC